MTGNAFDVIIVGAGMAGISAAACLPRRVRVAIVERESQPAYHATGRSAAMFTETYGNDVVRALTRAGRDFLRDPPPGFSDQPLLTPRGVMVITLPGGEVDLRDDFDRYRVLCPDLAWLDAEDLRRYVPALRPGYAVAGFLEPGACEIDVHGLLTRFLRQARAAGAQLITDAVITGLDRAGDAWQVETTAGILSAPVLVNAAGAWADPVAELAGVAALGITPMRRTVATVPIRVDISRWPLTFVADESLYFKPESGSLLVSPADETPSPPCDAQPEEIDVGRAIDRLTAAVDIEVRGLARKWAGLRSFAADKSPVVGFDPVAPGFFWLAGQGGYGIQIAPALARAAASLICDHCLPADLIEFGITAADLSPARLTGAP